MTETESVHLAFFDPDVSLVSPFAWLVFCVCVSLCHLATILSPVPADHSLLPEVERAVTCLLLAVQRFSKGREGPGAACKAPLSDCVTHLTAA